MSETFRSAAILGCFLLTAAGVSPGSEPPPPVTGGQISAPVHYDSVALVITQGTGVAIVDFTETIDIGDAGAAYRYRFLPGNGCPEQSGDGIVFEKYLRTFDPKLDSDVVTNDGGRLHVRAGDIRIEWSRGDEESGWIYYRPEQMTVQIVSDRFFETVALERFRNAESQPDKRSLRKARKAKRAERAGKG